MTQNPSSGRVLGVSLALLVVVGAIGQAGINDQGMPASIVPELPGRATQSVSAAWEQRLMSLSPRDPEAYLLLAEEVLDIASTPAERRVAIELLVRAFDVARATDVSSPTATSACLALADIATSRAERARLRSLAGALAPMKGNASLPASLHAESPEYLASVTIGLARAGYGNHAKALLRKPEVSEKLQSIDGLLARFGIAGGSDSVEREARRWPCVECGNRGASRRRDGQMRTCTTCKGTPGPDLSTTQLLAYLRGELWLLRDELQPWSLQVTLDDGQPAELADPGVVARLFRVDTSKAFWRKGAWRTNADGTDAPAAIASSDQLPGMPPAGSKPAENEPSTITPATQLAPAMQPAPGVPSAVPTTLPPVLPGLNPGPAVPTVPVPIVPPTPQNPSEAPLPGEVDPK